MPTSFWEQIDTVMRVLHETGPYESIIDIGAGYGKYGHLCREYLDHYPWRMQIDAIEAFPQYLSRIGFHGYNAVFSEDILKVKPGRRYDLALMIDVIEHFEKDKGYAAIDHVLSYADKILLATPRKPGEQGAEYGNEYETHRSEWSEWDFMSRYQWMHIGHGLSVFGLLSTL